MQIDSLTSLLSKTSLGRGSSQLDECLSVYISEVSSPTRLWIQKSEGDEFDVIIEKLRKFYNEHGDAFTITREQAVCGTKVAAKYLDAWHRAEIISKVSPRGVVRIHDIDFGTVEQVLLKNCRMLIEPFSMMKRKAIRGSLYGIQPRGGSKLWDLNVTERFIGMIRNKVHRIQIVKHHESENFYEFLLYAGQSNKTVNDLLIEQGMAERIQISMLLSMSIYPSFNMLEKLAIYPSFGERCLMLENHNLDFNKFEEANLLPVTNFAAFKMELGQALNNPQYSSVRENYLKVIRTV